MKKYIIPISIFFILTIIFTFPLIFKFNSAVYGPLYGTDSRGTIWQLWWGRYSYEHNLDYKLQTTVAAPFGNDEGNLPYGFLFLLIMRLLPIVSNEIFAYNFTLFMSFVLSCLFIYLLTFSITKDKTSSLISGIIFGFCPYHFQRTWEHFTLAQIQWPALYLFSLLGLYKVFNWKSVLLFIFASTCVLHLEFNYTFIILILTLLFFVFIFSNILKKAIFKQLKGNEVISNLLFKEVVKSGKIFFAGFLFLLINGAFLWAIVKAAFFLTQASPETAEMTSRPFRYLFTQSARPLSYFVPSSANPILGGLAKSLEGSIFYGRGPIEQTLYLGWVPMLLAWFAWKSRKSISLGDLESVSVQFHTRLFIFIAFSGILFSMPPILNFGLFKLYLPSFFLYKIFPMFRAYARFGLLTMLSVSILAGIGFKYFMQKAKAKNRVILSALFILLILFEFNNIPPFRVTSIKNTPAVYSWLAEQEGDFIIVEYPLGEASSGETYVELDYLLYQRIHQKRLMNGIRPGTEADAVKQKVFKIADPKVPEILHSIGVKYVIVHLQPYREGTNKKAIDIVGEVPDLTQSEGLKLVQKFGDDEVYLITVSPLNHLKNL
ncbi:hypothetical protein ACFL2J_07670 [Candidatus Omnitrophota bacterium]